MLIIGELCYRIMTTQNKTSNLSIKVRNAYPTIPLPKAACLQCFRIPG